ncbi:MAG TPA: hypothetical protein VGD98_19090 [Ktedonobacteraceae bacterium]
MEQRIYYGNINSHALADYLVGAFQQPSYYQARHSARAQKIVKGERIYVQIMRDSDWSGGHRAIGVHIVSIAGGVSVEMGASDWLNIDETSLAFGLLGALFFPPLLLFPLLQGLAGSGFSQDVWSLVETYCVRTSAEPGRPHAPQGFYCTYCGAFNHPGASRCHACHAPFNFTEQQPVAEAPAQSTPVTNPPTPPESEPPVETSSPRSTGATRPMFALMICPNCKATVVPAHFCGNCAAPLPDVNEAATEGKMPE